MLHPFPHETEETEPSVEFRGVTCGYDGTPALADVNLTIMAGDFVGLVGPSGAGKTTLLRAVLGAVDIYRGQVQYDLAQGARHHHMVCRQCGTTLPLDDELLEPLRGRLQERYGFRADLDHFAIFGLCKRCRDKQ